MSSDTSCGEDLEICCGNLHRRDYGWRQVHTFMSMSITILLIIILCLITSIGQIYCMGISMNVYTENRSLLSFVPGSGAILIVWWGDENCSIDDVRRSWIGKLSELQNCQYGWTDTGKLQLNFRIGIGRACIVIVVTKELLVVLCHIGASSSFVSCIIGQSPGPWRGVSSLFFHVVAMGVCL